MLHMAAESDSSKAVIELLISNGVDATCKDKVIYPIFFSDQKIYAGKM